MTTIPAGGFIDTPTTDQPAAKEPTARPVPRASDLRDKPMTLHVYTAGDGVRWSIVASNGPKVGDGGQGYSGSRAAVVTFLGRFLRFTKGEYSDVACKRHKSTNGRCRTFEVGDAGLGIPASRS